MRIDIDPGAGVCFGVEKAIEKAESMLGSGSELFGLGHMVHNQNEINRLEGLGLQTISGDGFKELKNKTVLIRAHGEPPQTYQRAETNGNRIIDATCPIVLRLQKKIRNTYEQMDHSREQIVIFGKTEHPETIGLLGQIGGDAKVIRSLDDLDIIDAHRNVILFSQTTMDPGEFEDIESALSDRLSTKGSRLKSNCTICGQMKRRKPGLAEFAVKYDVVIFVSGKNSSNGRMLFEFCLSLNKNTHWVSGIEELKKEWFEGMHSIGISGATSTPYWQLDSVKTSISGLINP